MLVVWAALRLAAFVGPCGRALGGLRHAEPPRDGARYPRCMSWQAIVSLGGRHRRVPVVDIGANLLVDPKLFTWQMLSPGLAGGSPRMPSELPDHQTTSRCDAESTILEGDERMEAGFTFLPNTDAARMLALAWNSLRTTPSEALAVAAGAAWAQVSQDGEVAPEAVLAAVAGALSSGRSVPWPCWRDHGRRPAPANAAHLGSVVGLLYLLCGEILADGVWDRIVPEERLAVLLDDVNAPVWDFTPVRLEEDALCAHRALQDFEREVQRLGALLRGGGGQRDLRRYLDRRRLLRDYERQWPVALVDRTDGRKLAAREAVVSWIEEGSLSPTGRGRLVLAGWLMVSIGVLPKPLPREHLLGALDEHEINDVLYATMRKFVQRRNREVDHGTSAVVPGAEPVP